MSVFPSPTVEASDRGLLEPQLRWIDLTSGQQDGVDVACSCLFVSPSNYSFVADYQGFIHWRVFAFMKQNNLLHTRIGYTRRTPFAQQLWLEADQPEPEEDETHIDDLIAIMEVMADI